MNSPSPPLESKCMIMSGLQGSAGRQLVPVATRSLYAVASIKFPHNLDTVQEYQEVSSGMTVNGSVCSRAQLQTAARRHFSWLRRAALVLMAFIKFPQC